MQLRTIAFAAVLSVAPGLLHAQYDFHLAGRDVQVHSFASQGFLYSNDNNYLTMKTSSGSFAFTDAGANVGVQLTDKFRVGAQFYTRNVGQLGNWSPELDWATADYRVRDWFGIRGGKVKTTLGLYNDVQDGEFLYTWAILPQSVYPIDQRGETTAHNGVDLYGNIDLKKLGGLAYTVFGGKRPQDPEGGFIYAMATTRMVNLKGGTMPVYYAADASTLRKFTSYTGPMYGADLRWNTPLKGVLVGVSYLHEDLTANGKYISTGVPYTLTDNKDNTQAFYGDYTRGKLNVAGEYRRQIRQWLNWAGNTPATVPQSRDGRAGYIAVSYRLSRWLEVGTYQSRFYYNWAIDHSLPGNHLRDQTVTARFDLTKYLDLKVEGHFIDGAFTSGNTNRGFYAANNASGIAPNTRLFVVRLGYHM
jgi:hypothetical protein